MIQSSYQDLLTSQGCQLNEELMVLLPRLVTQEQNEQLISTPTIDEVKDAVFGLSEESAPGPDGWVLLYHLLGYRFYWHIQCYSFILQQLFTTKGIHFILPLIPKKNNASTNKDYKPISLCNFIYKIIARLLNTRLSSILPLIFSNDLTWHPSLFFWSLYWSSYLHYYCFPI